MNTKRKTLIFRENDRVMGVCASIDRWIIECVRPGQTEKIIDKQIFVKWG